MMKMYPYEKSDHANVILHELSHKMTSLFSSILEKIKIKSLHSLYLAFENKIKKGKEERQKRRGGKRKGVRQVNIRDKNASLKRTSHSIRHAMRGRERSSLLSFLLLL